MYIKVIRVFVLLSILVPSVFAQSDSNRFPIIDWEPDVDTLIDRLENYVDSITVVEDEILSYRDVYVDLLGADDGLDKQEEAVIWNMIVTIKEINTAKIAAANSWLAAELLNVYDIEGYHLRVSCDYLESNSAQIKWSCDHWIELDSEYGHDKYRKLSRDARETVTEIWLILSDLIPKLCEG